jgi:hypothetical protein
MVCDEEEKNPQGFFLPAPQQVEEDADYLSDMRTFENILYR